MSMFGVLQALLFLLCITLLTKPVGLYLFAVYESEAPPLASTLGRLEQLLYRLCGVDPKQQQRWSNYAQSVLLFGLFGIIASFVILRLQQLLPLNPQHMQSVSSDLAFNTAVSFATNTNWQSYAGESTLSHLSQMACGPHAVVDGALPEEGGAVPALGPTLKGREARPLPVPSPGCYNAGLRFSLPR